MLCDMTQFFEVAGGTIG